MQKPILNKLRFKCDYLVSLLVDKTWQIISTYGMITQNHPKSKEFGSFGKNSLINFPQGTIYNQYAIHIGQDTMIGQNVSLSAGIAPGQKLISNNIIQIGNRCIIGRGSHIVGHFHIEICDDVMTGPYVYITDQNHSYEDIQIPVGRQLPKDKGVYIGKGAWIATGAVILPGSYVGENSVVAAGAVVTGFVPPRSLVAGVPAKIIRQFDGQRWVSVNKELSKVIPEQFLKF
jgi:acetyltransferase-like isoleucine patch superfamily enzyme